MITANGGGLTMCNGGAGSGGHIDIVTSDDSLYTGAVSSKTGQGRNYSGSGTIIRRAVGNLPFIASYITSLNNYVILFN